MLCPEATMLNTISESNLHSVARPQFQFVLPQESPPALKPASRRRVNFKDARIVGFVTLGSSMTQEERNNVWYQSTDLDDFKTQARSLCRRLREEDEEHTEKRGLEHRVCLDRQRNKCLALRCTLKAQSRSSCPEFIARISTKCTAWAKEVALAEATRDFCEVYYPHLVAHIPAVTKTSCPFPVPLKKRECDHQSDDSGKRRLRVRTEAI
jgi:hypothetical protein